MAITAGGHRLSSFLWFLHVLSLCVYMGSLLDCASFPQSQNTLIGLIDLSLCIVLWELLFALHVGLVIDQQLSPRCDLTITPVKMGFVPVE